jgi:methionyl-tRNA formyltransferase
MPKKPSILFIGKKDDFYCEKAAEFVTLHFPEHKIVLGKRNDVFPENITSSWQGDYIISYLSPWIISEDLLKSAGKAAINFHPGPPEYPGIGCTNFAIYHEDKTYGVTCHHMNKKVDTGKIIAVRRFPVYESDTVLSLTHRCYAHILVLFYEVLSAVLDGRNLPIVSEHWTREPFKRIELNALCELTTDMSESEIKRRVRAVTFPNAPGAYIKLGDKKIPFTPELNLKGLR